MIDRDENRADDDEREGQSEVVLDEAHSAFVGLARRGEKRDGAGLCRHDGEADRAPADRLVACEVMAKIVIVPRPPISVERDREQRADEHGIIDPAHEKKRLIAVEDCDVEDEHSDHCEVSVPPTAEESGQRYSVAQSACSWLHFAERDHVGKEPICAGHSSGQLPEPGVAGVDEPALLAARDEQPAIERFFAGIVRRENCCPGAVPFVRKIKSALLHPAAEIARRDFVREFRTG